MFEGTHINSGSEISKSLKLRVYVSTFEYKNIGNFLCSQSLKLANNQ